MTTEDKPDYFKVEAGAFKEYNSTEEYYTPEIQQKQDSDPEDNSNINTGNPGGEEEIPGIDSNIDTNLTPEAQIEPEEKGIDYSATLALIAREARVRGDIDIEDEELPTLNSDTLYEKYSAKHADRLRSELASQLTDSLNARGITEKNLEDAIAIQNGVSPGELLEISRYERLVNTPSEDITSDEKLNTIKDWRRARGISDKEIAKMESNLIMDEDLLEEDYQEAIGDYGKAIVNFRQQQAEAAVNREREELARREYNRGIVTKAINQGEIGEVKLQKEQIQILRSSLYDKTEPVQLQDGNTIKVSKFELFSNDLATNLEKQLMLFHMFTFREQEAANVKKTAKKDVENEILKGLANAEIVIDKNPNKQKLETIDPTKGRFAVYGGG